MKKLLIRMILLATIVLAGCWEPASSENEDSDTTAPATGDTEKESEASDDTDTATASDVDIDTATETGTDTASDEDTDTATETDTDTVSIPLSITKVSPADGAQGVWADSTIEITFSKAMNQSSVQNAISITGLLAGNLDMSFNAAGTVLTITPKAGLAYATGDAPATTTARTYTITVGATAEDLTGTSLDSEFTSSFETLRRISQTTSLEASAYYSTYGVIAMGGDISICTAAVAFQIGHHSSSVSSGDRIGVMAFECDIPSSIVSLESAVLEASQSAPEGDFYSGGVVRVEQLATQALDNTVVDPTVLKDLGTFGSSYVADAELDITSELAVNIADGERDFLFRYIHDGSTDNTFATFNCFYNYLSFQYLLQ